ncbi:MAG: tRNA (guanine-N1)-methyltransferase [Chlamydiae bacterium SM23_39]|nr:MAG: tRNA (guanine-N1)-methyltransferase [Chlamydiae bacterium SM23_39]
MKIDILSLFPQYFTGPFETSIIKRAIEKKIVKIRNIDIRDFSIDKHKKVDDKPYGGGEGMVMRVEPVCKAIRSVKKENSYLIYLTPQGKKFDYKKAKILAKKNHLIFLCGHYEGIDERAVEEVDEEISIGDYVLTNGCLAAIVVIDATLRFVKGVLGNQLSAEKDTYYNAVFKGPQYTRPFEFEDKKVPKILISGNHSKIAEYKYKKGVEKTKKIRPDLYKKHKLKKEKI